jgi:hypothetical protein
MAGTIRGEVPNIEDSEGNLLAQAEKLTRMRSRIKSLRGRLQNKNREVAKLREKLAQARSSRSYRGEETPVFFVVGRGRSGTTWLQTILNAHPEILCSGEGYFFGRDFRREEFKELRRPGLLPSSLYNAIVGSEYLRLWVERSPWTRGDDVEEHLDKLMRLAVDHFLTERLAKTGKRMVGDRTPFVSPEELEEIARIYPEAKIIHIIRDGRDVAVSSVHWLWNHVKGEQGGIYNLAPEELERREAYRKDLLSTSTDSIFTENRLVTIASDWSAKVSKTIELGPTLFGDRYAEARYEDLLEWPEVEVGRLLKFLGAEASEETVKRCVEAADFERLSKRKRGQKDYTRVRFRKGVAGDWKSVFTENDKRIFKEEAGNLLIKLGYEKDLDW